MMKKAYKLPTFGEWLRQQKDRDDVTGRISRDVIQREKELGRELYCFDTRFEFASFIRSAPKSANLTEEDSIACWNEWLKARREQEALLKAKKESPRVT